MRLLSSQIGPGPLVLSRPERAAPAAPPPEWPRWDPVRGQSVMKRIDPALIPPGWQSVRVRVPMRPATCEEVDCRLFRNGWTRVRTFDSDDIHMMEGRVDPDQAAMNGFGYYGPASLPPICEWNQPGTPCLQQHKLPAGLPPIYDVNGRVVLWNEFEDSLGGGIHRMQRLIAEGRD